MDFLVRLAIFAVLERKASTPSALEALLSGLGLEVSSADLSNYIQRQHLEQKTFTLIAGDSGRAYGLSPLGREKYLELKMQWEGIRGELEGLLADTRTP